MTKPAAALLPDGRLHLQHGPIDLIVGAAGDSDEVRLAYAQIVAAFDGVLERLMAELPVLRAPISPVPPPLAGGGQGEGSLRTALMGHAPLPLTPSHIRATPQGVVALGRRDKEGEPPHADGPVAKRMIEAAWPHRAVFVTPMAAVAGAVADEMLAAMVAGRRLQRAYVNDGGDIAIHLTPGQTMRIGVAGTLETDDTQSAALDGFTAIPYASPVRGIATSGRGGRSLSRGIADSVTVLARDAAAADVAATLVANAVDVDSPAIRRLPANQVKDDSDLGDIPVTVAVGALTGAEVDAALDHGAHEAQRMIDAGLIHGALLQLRGQRRVVGGARSLTRLADARHPLPEGEGSLPLSLRVREGPVARATGG